MKEFDEKKQTASDDNACKTTKKNSILNQTSKH